MVTHIHPGKRPPGLPRDIIRFGLVISGMVALLAVIGALTFGGPF